MPRAIAVLALLFAAAVWGLAFIFQKSAMRHIGPLAFIAARGVVAALALAPLALVEHRRESSSDKLKFLGVCIAGAARDGPEQGSGPRMFRQQGQSGPHSQSSPHGQLGPHGHAPSARARAGVEGVSVLEVVALQPHERVERASVC